MIINKQIVRFYNSGLSQNGAGKFFSIYEKYISITDFDPRKRLITVKQDFPCKVLAQKNFLFKKIKTTKIMFLTTLKGAFFYHKKITHRTLIF